jgi:sugar phosphate isomerase/epimerase
MKFGICTTPANASAAKSAGWDYVEVMVKDLMSDAALSSALPITAANVLIPGDMKITGHDVDMPKLGRHMRDVCDRAKKVGLKFLVFGSGGARNVPDGFDRKHAESQILEFSRLAAETAAKSGVTIVLEPLNRGECNIINSVAEAMVLVRKINHHHFRCLVDSYHWWLEDEPLGNVDDAMQWIAHVHVADKEGRVAPGESKEADYVPLFRVLKQGGYDGQISVEAMDFDIAARGSQVLTYLKQQWKDS